MNKSKKQEKSEIQQDSQQQAKQASKEDKKDSRIDLNNKDSQKDSRIELNKDNKKDSKKDNNKDDKQQLNSSREPNYSSIRNDEESNQQSKVDQFSSPQRFTLTIYGLASLIMFIVNVFVIITMSNDDISKWLYRNIWLFILILVFMFFLFFMLLLYPEIFRDTPVDIITLLLFSFMLGIVWSTFIQKDQNNVALMSSLSTFIVMMLIFFVIYLSDSDKIGVGKAVAYSVSTCFVLLFFFMFLFNVPFLHCFFVFLIIALFGIYIVYDAYEESGGTAFQLERKYSVIGGVMIYADIIIVLYSFIKQFFNLF